MATMGVDDETVVGPRHQDAIVIVDPFVQSKPTRPTQDRRQILPRFLSYVHSFVSQRKLS